MSTHNLCFEQKYKKYRGFYLKIFEFLEMKSIIYLNRHVFVMIFFLFPHKNIGCEYSLEVLGEALLMSTHNVYFRGEIKNNNLDTPFIWS